MVSPHDVAAQGVDLYGNAQTAPQLLQMNIEDFPARFLQDALALGQTPGATQISSTTVIDPTAQSLFQPVQRMLSIACAQLNCNSPGTPRLDPTRVVSAGLVVRRIARVGGVDQPDTLQAWMRAPAGTYGWATLTAQTDGLDPDPTKRPQVYTGRAELDQQLAAIILSSASAETTSPVFLAPPATCTAINRTVAYGAIPTASSDTSDSTPPTVTALASDLSNNLPALLRAGTQVPPLPGQQIDYRWMTDDFLNATFPPSAPGAPNPSVAQFQIFSTALRMLNSTFGAFDPTPEGQAIFSELNNYNVYMGSDGVSDPVAMGTFYQNAAAALLAVGAAGSTPITLPYAYDQLGATDPTALASLLVAALGPKTSQMLTPQGRFQDATRQYVLRMFFRVTSDHANCPPDLVWSAYSEPFTIAPWFAGGNRPNPPVPLPDPTDANFLKSLTPNCSFVVPKGLMSAMQGSTMSGLMNGSAGASSNLSLDWICGFNIPLITICAFFVLNIFLILLNLVFFWLPIIKICIPFPDPED